MLERQTLRRQNFDGILFGYNGYNLHNQRDDGEWRHRRHRVGASRAASATGLHESHVPSSSMVRSLGKPLTSWNRCYGRPLLKAAKFGTKLSKRPRNRSKSVVSSVPRIRIWPGRLGPLATVHPYYLRWTFQQLKSLCIRTRRWRVSDWETWTDCSSKIKCILHDKITNFVFWNSDFRQHYFKFSRWKFPCAHAHKTCESERYYVKWTLFVISGNLQATLSIRSRPLWSYR